MGMYTGLRFKAKLNDKGVAAIEKLLVDESWDNLQGIPESWKKVWRRNSIPFGALSYMPNDWVYIDNSRELVDGVWDVCCSLKNYEGEIEAFLKDVLPDLLMEPCEVEVLYEESNKSEKILILPPPPWPCGR